jgi:hypothetical protein
MSAVLCLSIAAPLNVSNVPGTSGTLTLKPNNTLIVAGQNATMRCSSSAASSSISWNQGAAGISINCMSTPGFATLCSPSYNELVILQPTTASTYSCAETLNDAGKAALVILGRWSLV